jgi:hypothetical protein
MKKLIVLSVLLGSTLLPYNHVSAQSENTETEETGKKGGYIYEVDGCFFHVVTHSILWGLITWEDTPEPMGCGQGGLWGEGHP